MVRTEFGLGDGKGPLEGGAGGRQLAKRAEHNPEVIQVESDVEVVGAKLGLQNGQRTLRELTCLLQLRPPPQVASRLIQQVGGQAHSASRMVACSVATRAWGSSRAQAGQACTSSSGNAAQSRGCTESQESSRRAARPRDRTLQGRPDLQGPPRRRR